MTEDRPFQSLPARLAGLPVDHALHDGVPEWLERPLRGWLDTTLRDENGDLSRRVVMRLRWKVPTSQMSYQARLVHSPAPELLTAVDAVLQLHPGWGWTTWDGALEARFAELMADLEILLLDAGSLYRLDWHGHCLVRRVDSTIQDAVDKVVAAAPAVAADHLRTAWVAAYGIQPDPDKAYDHAVLAIEDVACPLVSPKNPQPTLGTVIRDLNNQLSKWELAIGDETGKPADISRFIETMRMLWKGQSRHAGSANSRQQSQAEAEAAVHMAAALVQWLSTGVLRHKP